MSFCEYLWDDRANCLLIWVIDPDPIDVVTVEWLNNGEYQTIGVGVPGTPASGGFDILAVRLPDCAGEEPVILTVTGVSGASMQPGQSAGELTERITLDANANLANAERKHWLVVSTDSGPAIVIDDAAEKAPENAVSSIVASVRYGQTIGPAESATGEGQGGHLRLRVTHGTDEENGEPNLEFEVLAQDGMPLPETQIDFYTLSACEQVLPALEGGPLEIGSASNKSTAVLGSHHSQSRRHTFTVPSAGADQRFLSYLDRVVLVTSPPASVLFELSETRAVKAGRSGAVVAVMGKGEYAMVDDGALVDIALAAQPPRTALGNVDIIRAYGEAGKPMQPSDLDFASEITAATYSEISSAISRRHGSNAAQLTPVGIDQFLSAPSYFTVLSALPPERLAMGASRRLGAAVSTGNESEIFSALVSIALSREGKSHPRVKLWLSKVQGHAAFRAATLPFFMATLDVVTAGIDPDGVDLGQIGELAQTADLSKRRQVLDVLTGIDVLPMTDEYQFVSALSDDLEDHMDLLDGIVADVLAFCRRAVEASGLSDGTVFETRDLLSLGTIDGAKTINGRSAVQSRAYHWIRADLEASFGGTVLTDDQLPVSGLLDRIAAKLFDDHRGSFERISALVHQLDLKDPVELEADKVVKFDGTKTQSFAENAAPFERKPAHDDIAWLSDVREDPAVIASWKQFLLDQLDLSNRSKDQDSLGA